RVGACEHACHEREPRSRWVSTDALALCSQGSSPLANLFVGRIRAVVLIGPASPESDAPGTTVPAENQPWRWLNRFRPSVQAGKSVVLAVKGERFRTPRAFDDLELLFEHAHSSSEGGEAKPVGEVLLLEPADSYTQFD